MWKKCARRRNFHSIVLVVYTCCAFVCGDDSDTQLLTKSSDAGELEPTSDQPTMDSFSTLATNDDSKKFASSNQTNNINMASKDGLIDNYSVNLIHNSTTVSSNNLADQGQTDTESVFENSDYTTFNLISENTLSSESSVIDENFTAEVQKCCPIGQALYLGDPGQPASCKNYEGKFFLDIYWENSTHYWKISNTDSNNVHIKIFDPCNESKYNLDPGMYDDDTFFLLHNTSLYIPFTLEMFDTSEYCMDTIVSCSGVISNTTLICTPHTPITKSHYWYMTGLLLSTISLICLAIYTTKRHRFGKRVDNDERTASVTYVLQESDCQNCLAWFSATMATSYLLLTILSLNLFSSKIFAFLIYYLNLKYIIWLVLLCHAVCRYFNSNCNLRNPPYLKWYIIAAFTIPIVFVIILFAADFNNCNSNLTNSLVKNIFASSLALNLLLYFLPIILSCLGTVIYLVITYKQMKLPRNRYTNLKKLLDAFKTKIWDLDHENIAAINKIYFRSLLLFGFMFVFFLLDFVFYLLPSSGVHEVHFMFADVFFVLRGVFICFIFWRKNWLCESCKKKVTTTASTSEGQELNRLAESDQSV